MSPGAWEPSAVPVWFDPLREPTWLVPAVKTDAPRILYCAERWGEGRVDGAGRDLRLGVPAFLAEAARYGTNAWPVALAEPVDGGDALHPGEPLEAGSLTVLSAVAPEGRSSIRVRIVDEHGSIVEEIERVATDDASLGAAMEGLPYAVAMATAPAGVRPVWNSLYALPAGARLAAYVRGLHACHRMSSEALASSAEPEAVAARRADVRSVLGSLGTLATSTPEPFPALLFFGALLAAHEAGSPAVGEFRLPANARWTAATDRLDPVYAIAALVAQVFGDHDSARRRIEEMRTGEDPAVQRWLARVEAVT